MDCAEPITERRTGQLVLDYLTDALLWVKPPLVGTPHLTPDSALLASVNTKGKVKIAVQRIAG